MKNSTLSCLIHKPINRWLFTPNSVYLVVAIQKIVGVLPEVSPEKGVLQNRGHSFPIHLSSKRRFLVFPKM